MKKWTTGWVCLFLVSEIFTSSVMMQKLFNNSYFIMGGESRWIIYPRTKFLLGSTNKLSSILCSNNFAHFSQTMWTKRKMNRAKRGSGFIETRAIGNRQSEKEKKMYVYQRNGNWILFEHWRHDNNRMICKYLRVVNACKS